MVAFVLLIWWTVKVKHVALRVFAACLAFVPAMLFGVAAVNKYYDYYQSWGAVANDFTGQVANQSPFLPTLNNASSQKFAKVLGGLVNLDEARQEGYTVRLTVTGQRSHLRRTVLVYLPPQYFQQQYEKYRFPVLELFPGFPGEPQDWINVLGITTSLDTLVRDGLAKPVVLVMPYTNGDRQRMMQCLNIPHGPQDSTFLAVDVPTQVSRAIRVRPPGRSWAAIGYSEGGFCAANLALRYRGTYGDAGVMSGYFSPLDNLLGRPPRYVSPFAGYPGLQRENTPIDELPLLPPGSFVPQFWLGAGSGDTQDIAAARSFQQLLLRRQPDAQLILAPGGGHTMFTWRALVPSLLEWVTPRLTDVAQDRLLT